MRAALSFSVLAAVVLAGCDAQEPTWGLDRIATMKTPADPPAACGAQLPADPQVDARAACSFKAGALAQDTLGVSPALVGQLPIRHVIVVMRENRSFDHLFGPLHDHGQPDSEAVPADFTNPDRTGAQVAPFHADTTCLTHDPGHQSASMLASINGGKMDGFVKNAAATTDTDGHFVMAYNEPGDLPFYYFLANTYALDDRHFAPMASGTFGNRTFFMFGDNEGVVDTGIVYPPPNRPNILHLLMNAGYTWAAYSDGQPFSGTLDLGKDEPGVHPLADVYQALDEGTLPNVAFVDGTDSITDDHPTADLQKGEAWLKALYDHAIKSPQWNSLAIVWTYDEAGGFADHVPPPLGCTSVPGSKWDQRGPRVPLVVISPWAKRHYVSHAVEDHLAITRFIETLFGLPALSGRDANSPALLDLFDFSCGRDLSVPPAPDPGTGGCANPP